MKNYEWAENETFQKTTKTAYQKAAIAIGGGTPDDNNLKMCGKVLSGLISDYELALGLVTVEAIYNQLESDEALVTVEFIYNHVAGQFPIYAKALASI
jgi:hypothetical protein